MKKVNIQTAKTEINWNERQWVISDNCVVLTTGEHCDNSFSGTCLPYEDYPKGHYTQFWDKTQFTLLTHDIPFTISNED